MHVDWKSLPSLAALRAFDAAARHLSFSAGARSLNVTPAAIIQQVRGLEGELGLALVRREGRGIALTEEGKTLAKTLDASFGDIASCIGALRDDGARRGIRVTTTQNIVSEFLMSRMAEFWAAHPEIEVSLVPTSNRFDFIEEGFDIAIRGGDGAYHGVASTLLVETRWVVVTAPANIRAEPVDLKDLRWIFNLEFAFQNELIEIAGLDLERLDLVRLGAPGQSIGAAREGAGAMIAAAFILREDIRSGRLRAMELENMPRMAYWALTRPGMRRAPVALFIDWLKAVFTDEAARYAPLIGARKG